MSLFCALFIPAFLLWRQALLREASAVPDTGKPGQITGVLLGLIAALIRLNTVTVFDQRGFGLVFFLQQLIDGPAYDALVPLGVYLLLCRFVPPRNSASRQGAVAFSLAWLIPVAAARAFAWSSVPDPVQLVAIPVLMTVVALTVPHWVSVAAAEYGVRQVAAVAAACAVPLIATVTTWAFLTDRPVVAFPAFAVSLLCLLWTLRDEVPGLLRRRP